MRLRGLFLAALLLVSLSVKGQRPSSLDWRVDSLLARLTLEEKLSLMQHQNPAIPSLGWLPYSWWNEALHGVGRNGKATVFPMPIALAATWDTMLVRYVFRQAAFEAFSKFVGSRYRGEEQFGDNAGLTFYTPNINLVRDPRWGRSMETYGEDPWLTSQMGLSVIRGLQTRYDKDHYLSSACLKHFAAHSGPEGVRHQFNAQVSMRDLFTSYLSAFQYIIAHSDVQQVMCAYNRLNGEPCSTSEFLLKVLREEWKYNGLIVTDCWALNDTWERDTVIPRHQVYPTAAEAARWAFGSQVDMECGSGLPALRQAVDSGYISQDKIDEHVRRILRARLQLMVDQIPLGKTDGELPPKVGDASLIARLAAEESMVLLKNNGVLPLSLGCVQDGAIIPSRHNNIALLGPNSADSAMAMGNYNGDPISHRTFLQVMADYDNANALVPNSKASLYSQHAIALYHNDFCPLVEAEGQQYQLPNDRQFWKQLKQSDVIIFMGGLSPSLEGEELPTHYPGFDRGDRTAIELPAVQVRAIQQLKQRTHKPIVLVLCTGSAVGLEKVEPYVDAIVVAWYGGQYMNEALFDALTDHQGHGGTTFGRLPVTFYRNTAQLPAFDDYSMQSRTYRYMKQVPLYPFGYGLTYSRRTVVDSVWYDPKHHVVGGLVSELDGALDFVAQVYYRNLDDPEGPNRQLVGFWRPWPKLPLSYLYGGLWDEVPEDGTQALNSRFLIPIEADCFRYFDPVTQRMQPVAPGTRYEIVVQVAGKEFRFLAQY